MFVLFDSLFNFIGNNPHQNEAARYLTESAVWTVLEQHMFYKTMFKKTMFNETCLNWCEQGISYTRNLIGYRR